MLTPLRNWAPFFAVMNMSHKGMFCTALLAICMTSSVLIRANSAYGQPINFHELENHTIIVNLISRQTLRLLDQGGRIVNNELHQDISLRMRTHDLIDQNVNSKIVDIRNGSLLREYKAELTAQLSQPTKWRFGDMLFSYEDGNLVRLQTHEKGAFRLLISLKRQNTGLNCKAIFSVLGENGDKTVKTKSFAGTPIELIVATTKSSACRVIRSDQQ
jgi:hypothetical protein